MNDVIDYDIAIAWLNPTFKSLETVVRRVGKISQNIQHLQWSHIFNKVSCLQPVTLLKKDSIARFSLLILGVF